MQTHTITLKARVFSDEENRAIVFALNHLVDTNVSDADTRNLARTLIAELEAA